MANIDRRHLVAGGLAAAALGQALPAYAGAVVGKPAPKFKVTTFDHKTYSLADLKGNVILLNYWATWCGPCRVELPLIDSYLRGYRNKIGRDDLKIFAVTVDDTVSNSQLKPLASVLSFPLASHLDSWAYGAIGGAVPSNYVIDREGILRYAEAAAFTFDTLNEALSAPLLEGLPADAGQA